jgi:hypothetical protein
VRECLWFLFLAFISASICHLVFVHVFWNTKDLLEGWHSNSVAGGAWAPNQYRWLSFYLPEFLRRSFDMEILKAYLAVRVFCLTGAFFLTALIVRRFVSDRLAPSFVLLAVALFYAASTQPHYQPSEELNLLVFALFMYLVMIDANILTLSILMAIGVANKSTVGFLILFLLVYRWFGQNRKIRAVTDCAALSAIFVTGYVAIRCYYGTDRHYGSGLWQISHNLAYFFSIKLEAVMFGLATVLPASVILYRWQSTPLAVRCFLPAALLFVIGHLLISRVDEFRTYTPLALILWSGATAAVLSGDRGDAAPVSG